jgi:4-methylaminobutanoate oxidase (formaldehyde-forming)
MKGVDPRWPVLEDPSSFAYIRPEAGGLMVGLFEGVGKAWQVPSVPANFSFGEIEPDWDRLAPYLEKAMARVPATLEVGARKLFCGPESFTPDGGPLVGEAPELKNYFVAAGLNSIGILSGPGVGRLLAHWIRTGLPDMDVTGMNVDRFQRFQATPAFRSARVEETLGSVYKTHYPHKPLKTSRGAKCTPLHESLKARGAAFREVSGWECADWFIEEPQGGGGGGGGSSAAAQAAEAARQAARQAEPLSWGRHHWFGQWAEEHRACGEGAGLFDMSFMSKFRVVGPDAGKLLDWLSTSRVDEGVAPGTITYTQWLNREGRMEADLTVTKPPGWQQEGFLVVATDTAHRHVEARLRRYINGHGDDPSKGPFNASVVDVTSAHALITLQGPRSREILQAAVNDVSGHGKAEGVSADGDGGEVKGEEEDAAEADMLHDCSDAAFPFRAAQDLSIGLAPVLATRIT